MLKPAEVGVDWQVESEGVLVDLPALERTSPFTSLTHMGRPETDSSLVMSGDSGSLSAEPSTLKHSLDRVLFKSVPSLPPPLPPSLPSLASFPSARPDLRRIVSPGPCLLQDVRSQVYNFDSNLALLPTPSSTGEPVSFPRQQQAPPPGCVLGFSY